MENVSASYILLFPVNLFMDYFESELLAYAWWAYMRPMLALCHVAISTSALLIVAAAFERYLTISRIRIQFHRDHRIVISVVALVFALLCKAPLYFELEVVANENCTGVTEHKAVVAEWTEDEPYKTFYRFWFRNVITIFLPFVLLFYFNIQIVARLRRQHQGARLFRFATSEHRKNIRAATRMLVLVSCTYLASNILNVIVSAWEFIDVVWLRLQNLLYAHKKVSGNSKSEKVFQQTMRYCNSGNGLVIYEMSNERNPALGQQCRSKCIGTGLDKVVLSVALGQLATRGSRLSLPSRIDELHESEKEHRKIAIFRHRES
ncbi:hypothetical protein Tcan_11933 [Toxocara canis]|uniref:G-protein coupled receptors family 1 profile domain-containing protein n=2 Tax=Toxocara canis TaxID=6265 RepID=A0A0B2VCN2_TOXCA|nr:hypothetical protein Tcan_11933 [Toxocara canis]VDM24817.1 unnamed protein product [Toxocara canis]